MHPEYDLYNLYRRRESCDQPQILNQIRLFPAQANRESVKRTQVPSATAQTETMGGWCSREANIANFSK
jgi:hypothetical protein